MYGSNPTRKRANTLGDTLVVQGAPWKTIQGEGPFSGYPATFIRLWGCHLQCYFCDTDFESDARPTAIHDLAGACGGGAELVVLTGGEPMRQNIVPLCQLLVARGHTVQIETAGSFWWYGLAPLCAVDTVHVVVSPKTPRVHQHLVARAWKYIISVAQGEDPDDGLPFMNTQAPGAERRRLARPHPMPRGPVARSSIFVQPMDEGNVVDNRRNMEHCTELAMKYGYRISLQQHKILEVS